MKHKDRHDPSTVQLKAWIPVEMRDKFAAVCADKRVTPSATLRALIQGFININRTGTQQ